MHSPMQCERISYRKYAAKAARPILLNCDISRTHLCSILPEKEDIMTYQILLIEDDLQICEILTDYLMAQKENVFRVRCANDGEKGLEQIVEGQYDLVLLDIMLPRSWRKCWSLRGKSKENRPPLIFAVFAGWWEDIVPLGLT